MNLFLLTLIIYFELILLDLANGMNPKGSKRKHGSGSSSSKSTKKIVLGDESRLYPGEEYNAGEIVEVNIEGVYLLAELKNINDKEFTAVIKGGGNLNGSKVKGGTYYVRKALEVGDFVGLKNKDRRIGQDEVLLSKVIQIKENGKYEIQIIQKPLFEKNFDRFPKELTITKVFAVGEDVEVYNGDVWVKAKVVEVPGEYRDTYLVEYTEQSELYGDIYAINMIKEGTRIQH
uniref:Uncharacterized protein n=1 Tax=Meloidogyne enterolobii TaxID=390850 RepID=A0A6V7UMU1_MELEN|nr:unnamed protein product [Meloidogyne enterolobii]